jgi:sulfite reductase beta subunit-like hemoprotein
MTVGISGCPNGCAHTRVADIGLSGGIKSEDGQKQEVYDLYMKGGMGRTNQLAELIEKKIKCSDVISKIREHLHNF